MSGWDGDGASSWNEHGAADWQKDSVSKTIEYPDGIVPQYNIGENVNGDYAGQADYDGTHTCRNCGEEGHFARECPHEKKMTGECFNCGQVGHSKAGCPNPRIERASTGTCRLCNEEGHHGSDCPTAPPTICKNCQNEGHKASECTENRIMDFAGVEEMSTEEAWAMLKKASDEQDIDDFKKAVLCYSKADRDITFYELEMFCSAKDFSIHFVALEKELPLTMTSVNLQGKAGCKYVVSYSTSIKPKRAKFASGWPSSTEENLERLKDAGIALEHHLPLCHNCNKLGHTSKFCKEEKAERSSAIEITCSNCNEIGHRLRDCAQPRQARDSSCRNCGKEGHKATECTEPRSAANVECRKCGEMGHFSKDCPQGGGGNSGCRNCGEEGHLAKECDKPRNPANSTCRNCDEVGHFSKDCLKPKDWSRVKCSNCNEMGHTKVRCKAASPDDTAPISPQDETFHTATEDFGAADGEQAWQSEATAGAW